MKHGFFSLLLLGLLCIMPACKRDAQPLSTSETSFPPIYRTLDETFPTNIGWRQVIGTITTDEETMLSQCTFSLTSNSSDTKSLRTAYITGADLTNSKSVVNVGTNTQLVRIVRRQLAVPNREAVTTYFVAVGEASGKTAVTQTPSPAQDTTRVTTTTAHQNPTTSAIVAKTTTVPPVVVDNANATPTCVPAPTQAPVTATITRTPATPHTAATRPNATPAPPRHPQTFATPLGVRTLSPSNGERAGNAIINTAALPPPITTWVAAHSTKLSDYTFQRGEWFGISQFYGTKIYVDRSKVKIAKVKRVNGYTLLITLSGKPKAEREFTLTLDKPLGPNRPQILHAPEVSLKFGVAFLRQDIYDNRIENPRMASLLHPDLSLRRTEHARAN